MSNVQKDPLGKVYYLNFADMTVKIHNVVYADENWVYFKEGNSNGTTPPLTCVPNTDYHTPSYFHTEYDNLKCEKSFVCIYCPSGILACDEFRNVSSYGDPAKAILKKYKELNKEYLEAKVAVNKAVRKRDELSGQMAKISADYKVLTGHYIGKEEV